MGKLCWLRDHRPRLFQSTWRFVLGSGLIAHLLGGSATCDHSLAGGTLFYDINQKRWSHQVLSVCNLPVFKLPDLAPAGKAIGTVAPGTARGLGLPANVQLILGGHDFCCSALGAGVIDSGMAVYSIGSSMHLAPVFQAIPLTSLMLQRGLTMEIHVVPDRFLTHVYNRAGGQVLRWFRDKLAPLEKREAKRRGSNVYTTLLAEMPGEPTGMMILPQVAESGAPHYDSRRFGAALGFDLGATRGEVIKALLEGITYPFLEGRALFEQVGMRLQVCRAIGGGGRGLIHGFSSRRIFWGFPWSALRWSTLLRWAQRSWLAWAAKLMVAMAKRWMRLLAWPSDSSPMLLGMMPTVPSWRAIESYIRYRRMTDPILQSAWDRPGTS